MNFYFDGRGAQARNNVVIRKSISQTAGAAWLPPTILPPCPPQHTTPHEGPHPHVALPDLRTFVANQPRDPLLDTQNPAHGTVTRLTQQPNDGGHSRIRGRTRSTPGNGKFFPCV